MDDDNPMGREYNSQEVGAALRLGLAERKPGQALRGPLIWATGPYYPHHARRMARDWLIVADAIEREWSKPIPAAEEAR